MLKQEQTTTMQIHHGHDGKNVVMQFSIPTQQLAFSPDQARKLIGGVQGALDMLEAHLAAQAKPVEGLASMAASEPPAAETPGG